jgi:hypothetical protein
VTDNEMCNEPYTRPLRLFPSDGLVVPVRCTFLKDHGANHSWYALQASDEAALEAKRRARGSDLPPHIATLIQEIEDGQHDPYIEALLDALHGRKLCRRGVAGFRTPRRVS